MFWLRLVRQGEGGVLIKEGDGSDKEVVPECGHDRPVFQANNMMKAERVPADDVGVLDGAIGRSPCGKTFMTLAAGDVGAGGVEFIGMIGCDPHLMLGEGADPLGGIVGGDDGNGGLAAPKPLTPSVPPP